MKCYRYYRRYQMNYVKGKVLNSFQWVIQKAAPPYNKDTVKTLRYKVTLYLYLWVQKKGYVLMTKPREG